MPSSNEAVLARITSLYEMLFAHDGYGEMTVELRYLRKREKEVIIRCGKQYRYVVPVPENRNLSTPDSEPKQPKETGAKRAVPRQCGTRSGKERMYAE